MSDDTVSFSMPLHHDAISALDCYTVAFHSQQGTSNCRFISWTRNAGIPLRGCCGNPSWIGTCPSLRTSQKLFSKVVSSMSKYVCLKQTLLELLVSDPRNLLHLVKLHRPSACHVEEVTETIQIPLNSRIHLVLLDKGNHATLGTTTDRTAHLQGSSSFRRSLLFAIREMAYGNRERSERRQLRIQLVDPVFQDSHVFLGELGLLDLVRSTVHRGERNDSLR